MRVEWEHQRAAAEGAGLLRLAVLVTAGILTGVLLGGALWIAICGVS